MKCITIGLLTVLLTIVTGASVKKSSSYYLTDTTDGKSQNFPITINIPFPLPSNQNTKEKTFNDINNNEEKKEPEEMIFEDSVPRFEEVSIEEMKRRTHFPETPTDENGLPGTVEPPNKGPPRRGQPHNTEGPFSIASFHQYILTYQKRTTSLCTRDKANEGSVLVGGDMLIKKENLHLWESGMANGQTWSYYPQWRNPISLGIDPNMQTRSPQIYQWTLDSINEIMQKTCIRFNRIYQPINGPYMFVKLTYKDCSTTLGQVFPRENVVNLGIRCTNQRTPAHEIIHSLGRYHEQNRMDRDNYIRINYQFIDCLHEYEKYPSDTLGIPYDYYSVMHYSVNSCADGGPTMTFPPEIDVSRVGREEWLTQLDIDNINRRYCQNDR